MEQVEANFRLKVLQSIRCLSYSIVFQSGAWGGGGAAEE